MSKSKKLFIFIAIVFLLLMVYMGYDISRRTTFPGSKPQLKERIFSPTDSVKLDSASEN